MIESLGKTSVLEGIILPNMVERVLPYREMHEVSKREILHLQKSSFIKVTTTASTTITMENCTYIVCSILVDVSWKAEPRFSIAHSLRYTLSSTRNFASTPRAMLLDGMHSSP